MRISIQLGIPILSHVPTLFLSGIWSRGDKSTDHKMRGSYVNSTNSDKILDFQGGQQFPRGECPPLPP